MSKGEPDFGENPKEELQPEVAAEKEIQAEMPKSFEDPEGKSGKWKEVIGEVEIEGNKVEIKYREKVIELPKHRQEETGIKRIRRRELLPPFPEGLQQKTDQRESYSSDKKFDSFYNFLTNCKFPSEGTWVHKFDHLSGGENVDRLKKAGLYFQRIYSKEKFLFYSYKRPYGGRREFSNPVFIFGNKNDKFLDYLEANSSFDEIPYLSESYAEMEGKINIPDEPSEKCIRWCHAECALVPTKRSLNVLFFETGEKDKAEKEK